MALTSADSQLLISVETTLRSQAPSHGSSVSLHSAKAIKRLLLQIGSNVIRLAFLINVDQGRSRSRSEVDVVWSQGC